MELSQLAFIPLPDFIADNLGWWIFGLVVVVGLLGLGLRDVSRFSLRRVWAISSVSFAESIRRRVLWITPLAILGVIVVAQLQKPVDAQDAIRQTTKIALFATGGLVAMVSIILACTSLPKEIDNRVIYTIVTKPTTRLEIIAGKVLGFARVSLAILLIMGLFTWGYLHVRAWSMERDIRAQLAAGRVDEINRPLFEHYAQAGLLNAKAVHDPARMDIFSRVPEADDRYRWVLGYGEQDIMVPFHVPPASLAPPGQQTPSPQGLIGLIELHYEQRPLTDREIFQMTPMDLEDPEASIGPRMQMEQPGPDDPRRLPRPQVTVQVMSRDGYHIINAQTINDGQPINLPPAGSGQAAEVFFTAQQVRDMQLELQRTGMLYLQVYPLTPGVEYAYPLGPTDQRPAAVSMLVPGTDQWITPSHEPMFRARPARMGQQLRGGTEGPLPVAVYQFRNATVSPGRDNMVQMEMPRVSVERTGIDLFEEDEITELAVRVRNLDTGEISEPVIVAPETNRTTYFDVPASALAGGNYDVIVQCISPGHFVGVSTESLLVVAGNRSFAYNLTKSLGILWLMSLLVIIVSIFCSTFLSWPIAVVLTVVILLGHWGVQRLGEEGTGIGPRVATELGFRPAEARVVSETVEALNRFLHFMGAILPDISRFSATDDIERGVSIPHARLADALWVALGFGIPLMILSYVFLKNKEVAP